MLSSVMSDICVETGALQWVEAYQNAARTQRVYIWIEITYLHTNTYTQLHLHLGLTAYFSRHNLKIPSGLHQASYPFYWYPFLNG